MGNGMAPSALPETLSIRTRLPLPPALVRPQSVAPIAMTAEGSPGNAIVRSTRGVAQVAEPIRLPLATAPVEGASSVTAHTAEVEMVRNLEQRMRSIHPCDRPGSVI